MPCIDECEVHTGKDLPSSIISHPRKILQSGDDIILGVERFEKIFPLLPSRAVDLLDVFFLDMSAVHQHDRAEITGGRCAYDITGKTVFYQARDVSGMVDMRMRENEDVDGFCFTGPLTVELIGFFAFSLEQPAIKKYSVPIHFDQVSPPRHGPG